ncbi:MAG: protoheme IX farnesyltransferase [Anaerolineae bacterium]|nr:MAG: protoheme IX farnesyltransferase [Anaerolineae bacterium]
MSVSKMTDSLESPLNGSPAAATGGWRGALQMTVVLFKLRIVFLLLMAATAGAFLAAGGWPGWGVLLLTWVTGGLAASGASALNQYWERKRDGLMGRTRQRPLVNGDIADPRWVPWVSIALILVPVLAVLPFNRALAFFLALGAFIYVVIYTIWLKPRTLLNIVIGGAAGSAAVLSGSAAAGAWNDTGALVLAVILFLWTPFHFWSLAILYRDEYRRAGVPMLPARTTPQNAAWWIMAHTLPTVILSLLMVMLPGLGWLYFLPVLAVTVELFYRNVQLIRDPAPQNARKLFMSSNYYLLVLLLAICVDMALPW